MFVASNENLISFIFSCFSSLLTVRCNLQNLHIFLTQCVYLFHIIVKMDRDSSVCIATCYGLDGPGIESRWR
jgi:hypothetical protein